MDGVTAHTGSSPWRLGGPKVSRRETDLLTPFLSLFQTRLTSRRASSLPVCSVSPSSSKCPGVSVPTHPGLGPSEGRGSYRASGVEREATLGWRLRGSQGEGTGSGSRKEPTPALSPRLLQPPHHHQAKVPRKGSILGRAQDQGDTLLPRK